MSLKESIVEDAALARFGAQRCEFKEAANNFSSTLATLRDKLLPKLPKLPSGELSLPAAILAAQAGVASVDSGMKVTT